MELHFEARGTGKPLIILHGLFGSQDNWRSISARLSSRYTVFALDQRNHGRSPHSEHMDYTLMAEDIVEFQDAQGLSEAFVLGHSMGGKTAMQLALLYPQRVEKLIVADMAPRAYPPWHEKMIAGMLSLDLNRFESRTQMDAALAPAVPELATRQFLLKNVARSADHRFMWRMGLKEIQKNYSGLTQPITSKKTFNRPVLFVRGANSEYLTEADLPEIVRLFPEANMETVPNAAHLLHVQNPAYFVDVVDRFLAR